MHISLSSLKTAAKSANRGKRKHSSRKHHRQAPLDVQIIHHKPRHLKPKSTTITGVQYLSIQSTTHHKRVQKHAETCTRGRSKVAAVNVISIIVLDVGGGACYVQSLAPPVPPAPVN